MKSQILRANSALLTGIIALLLISACAPGEKIPDSTRTPATGYSPSSWSVTLEMSGGIAGKMQRISLDQNGTAVLVDIKLKTQTEKQLSQAELQAYADALKSLSTSKQTETRFSKCRDCFTYTLITTSDSGKQTVATDDLQLQHSGARELINLLTGLASDMNKRK